MTDMTDEERMELRKREYKAAVRAEMARHRAAVNEELSRHQHEMLIIDITFGTRTTLISPPEAGNPDALRAWTY